MNVNVVSSTQVFSKNSPSFGAISISQAKKVVKGPIRVLFSDIDGTIYNADYKVPPKTKEAIKKLQENDVNVVLTTGRGYRSLDKMYADFGMNADYAVTESGTIIVDAQKNKIAQNLLSLESVRWILKVADELKQRGLFRLSFDGDSYTEGTNAAFRNTNISVHGIKSFNEILDKGMLPARAIFAKMDSKSFADIEPLKRKLMSIFGDKLSVFVSGHKYCEITNKDVSKASGIEALCKKLNYEYKNMACIGDAENDISMARFLSENGGMSICMGNGTKQMKQSSRFLTADVDSDGFSRAAEAIIEINRANGIM